MVNKYFIYGAAVAARAVGGTQILKYNSLRKELEIQVILVQRKASLKGVELILEVIAKNPTCNSFSIKYLQITNTHGTAFISSTASEQKPSLLKKEAMYNLLRLLLKSAI